MSGEDMKFDSGLPSLFEDSREIFLSGDIEPPVESHLLRMLKHLKGKNSRAPVTVHFNTQGGCTWTGMAMYDMIRLCPFEVTMVGWGEVCSAGAVLLQAGDERLLGDHSCFMIHEGSASLPMTGLDNLKGWVGMLDKDWQRHYEVLLDRIREKKPRYKMETLVKQCKNDWFMSAAEAVEFGLADGIVDYL